MNKTIIYKDVWCGSADRYYIDEAGNISCDGDLPICMYESPNGYNYVLLRNVSGRNNFYPIDHIMMMVFHRADVLKNTYVDSFNKNQFDVVHLDGNNRNNTLGNLRVKKAEETWVDVTQPEYVRTGFYEISNLSRIRYKHGGKIKTVSLTSDKDGYAKVNLIYDTPDGVKYKNTSIHRLMASHFVYNPTGDTVVNHIDGDKYNNHPSNLEFVTFEKNSTLASMTGLYSTSKITTDEVDLIIELLLQLNGSIKAVYDAIDHNKYPNLSYPVITSVKQKVPTYIRPEGKYDLRNIQFADRLVYLTNEEIEMIVEMLLDPKYGCSPTRIMQDIDHNRYPNINKDHISRIKNKVTTYKDRGLKYDIESLNFGKTKYRGRT